jgi:hypothetical protein
MPWSFMMEIESLPSWLMAAASGGWILAEIHPVRFVSSRIFKQEMDGPTGLVGKLSFEELKAK